MNLYLGKQYFLKALVIVTAILVIIAMTFIRLYYFENPSSSRIYVNDYSRIIFDRVNCQSIYPSSAIWSFPIVLHYQSPDAYTSFQTKDGYYSAQLRIFDIGAMYLTTSDGAIAIQNSGQVQINIQAQTFNWDSKIIPNDFSSIQHLEFDRLYGHSEDEDGYYFDKIFDWIKPTSQTLTMGLCADDLTYFPAQKGVSFTNLNSIALLTTPERSGDKVALLFRFGNVASLSINNKSYPPDDEIELRVIQNDSYAVRGFGLVATGLNDPDIAICDSFTQLEPGFICSLSGGRAPNSTDELLDMKGNAQTLTVISPSGWGEQRFVKIDLPEKTNQLTVSAQVGNVEISQEAQSIPLTITGNRLSALANGSELFPSPWEALPPELKNAYITAAVAVALGIISIIASNWLRFASFFGWLFSRPHYRQPVHLPIDAHIFRLINGKKISGIIESLDGRSTYRVFVLKEVREWDKDNWSDVLPTEVRVPQNQIEMYYRAHP